MFFFSPFRSLGSNESFGSPVDWMDSKGEEISMWQAMLDRPDTWIDGTLILRPHMNQRGMAPKPRKASSLPPPPSPKVSVSSSEGGGGGEGRRRGSRPKISYAEDGGDEKAQSSGRTTPAATNGGASTTTVEEGGRRGSTTLAIDVNDERRRYTSPTRLGDEARKRYTVKKRGDDIYRENDDRV